MLLRDHLPTMHWPLNQEDRASVFSLGIVAYKFGWEYLVLLLVLLISYFFFLFFLFYTIININVLVITVVSICLYRHSCCHVLVTMIHIGSIANSTILSSPNQRWHRHQDQRPRQHQHQQLQIQQKQQHWPAKLTVRFTLWRKKNDSRQTDKVARTVFLPKFHQTSTFLCGVCHISLHTANLKSSQPRQSAEDLKSGFKRWLVHVTI